MRLYWVSLCWLPLCWVLYRRYKWNTECVRRLLLSIKHIIIHEHYALFMWNHQRWTIGRTHRKRERDIARWGEGEREKVEGEGMALVFIEDSYFGFDHCPKSTRGILRYRYWSYLHKVISRRLQILKSLVQRYFYFPTVFLVLMTSARITQMFST